MAENDVYNVDNYTERELFEILNIDNPTDRELEISIYKNMEKHKINSPLYNFFKDVYDRFFDDEEEVVEGFKNLPVRTETAPDWNVVMPSPNNKEPPSPYDNRQVTTNLRNRFGQVPTTTTNPIFNASDPSQRLLSQSDPKRTSREDRLNPGITSITDPLTGKNVTGTVDIKEFTKDKQEESRTTHNVDYVKDNLNPIKRETMFKMISIDSQFREDPRVTSATNFTMNLSSSIENVISLKLYSIQIPYTWYMVNEDSGSNYFFIKGNSPGINNSLNNIKVDIGSGNYTPENLTTTINKRFAELSKEYNYVDISFGNTNNIMQYDSTSAKVRFTFDIKKWFFDCDYELDFPYWSSPTEDGENRNATIPSFLGFNYQSYNARTVYGNRTQLANNIPNTNRYILTNANNFFTVIQYIGPQKYTPGVSTVIQTIKVVSSLTKNIVQYEVADIFSNFKQLLASPNALFESTKNNITKLQENLFDLEYTSFNKISVTDPSLNWNGHTHYELSVKLNRKTTETQTSNAKIAVFFPHNDTWNITQKIWIDPSSCFMFDNSYNELSEIVSETSALITNYIVGNQTHKIQFTCVNENYNVSENNFVAFVPSSESTETGFLLNDYIEAVNNGLETMNAATISDFFPNGYFNINSSGLRSTYFDVASSIATFQFDITRIFDQSTYVIDLSNCFLSRSPFNFGTNGLIKFNGPNDYNLSCPINPSTYTVNKGEYISISPRILDQNGNTKYYGNQNEPVDQRFYLFNPPVFDPPNTTNPSNETFNSISQLRAFLNNFFNSQSILRFSSFEYFSSNNNAVDVSLNLVIKQTLSEIDYKVEFISPGNKWTEYLGIREDSPYDLSENMVGSYSKIYGLELIFDNRISITKNNDTIKILPYYNGIYDSTGENDIVIKLINQIYTRTQLIDAINDQLDSHSVVNGSAFSFIRNETNVTTGPIREYTTFRLCANKIFTTIDYKLVFFDTESFSYCSNIGQTGAKSVKTGTWDSTLGWLLGFHSFPEYVFKNFTLSNDPASLYADYYYNSYTKEAEAYNYSVGYNNTTAEVNNAGKFSIKGDSVLNTNLYNYFLIILDDYIQNHVNDGLVTITSVENDIALPTYANRVSYQCDPVTGKKVAVSATNNQYTNLTSNQLYAMNQIMDARKYREKSYASGPVLKDVFALVPLKLSGMSFGNTYMEFGGTLQNQDRKYFGPVRIQKFTVKLMNDKGEVVNLNGTNWSLTIICEILVNKAGK
jgi:hypothetical protein